MFKKNLTWLLRVSCLASWANFQRHILASWLQLLWQNRLFQTRRTLMTKGCMGKSIHTGYVWMRVKSCIYLFDPICLFIYLQHICVWYLNNVWLYVCVYKYTHCIHPNFQPYLHVFMNYMPSHQWVSLSPAMAASAFSSSSPSLPCPHLDLVPCN